MRSRRRLSRRQPAQKETTPHLWVSASLLLSAVVLFGSCSSTPAAAPPAEVEAETAPANEPAFDATTSDGTVDAPRVDQSEGLSERNRNLAAQAAELAADNRFLRSRVAELESELAAVREENAALLSLVDDILLAQGVLRGSAAGAQPTESTPGHPPVVEEPRAAPQPPVLVRPAATRVESPAEAGDESPTSRREGADEENRPPSESVALPAPADADRLEATRATRESNLRFRRDGETGTVQYVDSRIAYDAPNVAYLSVQALPGRAPTMHLHLRATAPADSRSLGMQTAVLSSVGQEFHLDTSNSTMIGKEFGDRLVSELVAPVSPALFDTLRRAIRAGGSIILQGLSGSRAWELSALERAAMTNVLYAFQDLGGNLPR